MRGHLCSLSESREIKINQHIINLITNYITITPTSFLKETCSLCFHHGIIMKFSRVITMTDVMPMQKVKVRGQRSRSQKSNPHLGICGP